MLQERLKKLVHFEVDKLREAIRAFEQEADSLEKQRQELLNVAGAYKLLMRAHGLDDGGLSVMMPERSADGTPRGKRGAPTIGGAAVLVLTEHGGTLHAKKILEQVQAKGFMKNPKNPMAVLLTALRREPRIERDLDSGPNMWRLKK